MTTISTRRGVLFGSLVAATVLALASTALACTGYRGKLRVTDSNSNWVESYGATTGDDHERCSTPTHGTFGDGIATSGTPQWATGTSITITVTRQSSCGTGTSTLDNGTYTLTYIPQQVWEATTVDDPTDPTTPAPLLYPDCMNPPGTGNTTGYGIQLGQTVTIDSTTTSVNRTVGPEQGPALWSDSINWQSGICISNATGSFGNQVPFTIL